MNSILMGFLGGASVFLAPRISKMIVRAIRPMFDWLIQFFTSIDDKFETATGIPVPERGHMMWDGFFRNGLVWTEENVFTEEFFNEMQRIFRGDPSKISERALTKMESIDWSKGLNQALPEEVKQIVNITKESMTNRQVKASMAALPEAVKPSEEKAIEIIRTMAPAVSKSIPAEKPALKNDEVLPRIAETKRKLLEHLATLETKN